ncbi:MAG TPA: amino acid ABC transporter permease [Anaerolineales bacterium]|nr:amino acid ABC transporter permease [Anaerolineales bacterium]
MAINIMKPPGQPPRDPDLSMGHQLMSLESRTRLIYLLQISTVWIVLVILLALALALLNFDIQYVRDHYAFIVQGTWTTLGLSMVSILFATILALLGALGRISNNPIAQGAAGFYVSLVRGTPLLIQIYLIYLGLPQIGTQLKALGLQQLGQMFTLTALQSGILALSLNYGAYMTEIFRAGIQSISYGQREAATAIGMNRWQTMRRIILPQAVRIIIPDIGNQFIAMQKDTAQVSVMGIWELTFRANRLARQESKFVEMLLLAALLYWILTIISSWLEGRLERRLAHAYER